MTTLTDATTGAILWGPTPHITSNTPKGVFIAETGTTPLGAVTLQVAVYDDHGGLQLTDSAVCA